MKDYLVSVEGCIQNPSTFLTREQAEQDAQEFIDFKFKNVQIITQRSVEKDQAYRDDYNAWLKETDEIYYGDE